MLRIHLIQVYFNPSYYDSGIDYLAEPTVLRESDVPLGKLRDISEIGSLLLDLRAGMIEHATQKLTSLASWSADNGAEIAVFPEYSVPLESVPALQKVAVNRGLLIIAGSHRVPAGEESQEIYQVLGVPKSVAPIGGAVAPVLSPDGQIYIFNKLRRSKWEPNLQIPAIQQKATRVKCGTTPFRLAVIPCIDSLHVDILGDLWKSSDTAPELVVCPSYSPSTEPFTAAGLLTALKEVPFAFVNSASFGGTRLIIPTELQNHLSGTGPNVEDISKDTEAVLSFDIDLSAFSLKRGSIDAQASCTKPILYPIIYRDASPWHGEYEQVAKRILSHVKAEEMPEAIEELDSYLTEAAQQLPQVIRDRLKFLRHSVLPFYGGDPLSVVALTQAVILTTSSTSSYWAERVNSALRSVTASVLTISSAETTSVALAVLAALKRLQVNLGAVGSVRDPTIPGSKVEQTLPLSGLIATEPNIVDSFQNRGSQLDTVRDLLNNAENRVIIVTGAVGVGKTAFLSVLFQKSLSDWNPIRVRVPNESRVPRLMADIAYQLGIQLDIDSIASASHNVFREKARKICSTLFSLPKRALIIDDLAEILRSGTVKEVNQLTILLEEAAKPISFTGGRIFVLSSIWAPDKWFRMAGISHLPLKRLTDKYIRRVIEFHMRAAGLVSGDNPPRIPQELLNVVDGHPLSARLVVDVLRSDGEDLDALTQDLATVTGKLATELLKRVELSAHERELMIRLAVFRLPVLLGVLLEIDYSFKVSDLLGLTKRFILYHDGRALGMHEAVRRYFYSRIGSAQERQKLHRIAAAYYDRLYDADRQAAKKDPSIIAELAHHLVLAGEGSRARTLKSIVIEEMKPAARKLYKEDHDYEAALDVYRLLSDVAADDAEVWAYVGRCYARLGLWEDSDGAFEKALDVASRTGVQRWWIYRDWGHIRARFEYYEFASELLVKAAQLHSEDAGISASLAYMHWREGDEEEARRLFEEALELNHYHEYTLTYYPKLLDELGEGLYAIELRKRLAAFQSEAALHSRTEHEMDVDADDI